MSVDYSAYQPPQHTGDLIQLAARECMERIADPIKGSLRRASLPRPAGIARSLSAIGRGNPDRAMDYYRGRFAFGGTVIENRGKMIFDHQVPDRHFVESLHGFAWLVDLAANDRELARVQARSYITDWQNRYERHGAIAWAPKVTARRLLSWLQHLDFLLAGAPGAFSLLLIDSLYRQSRRLNRQFAYQKNLNVRLDMALALYAVSICLDGMETTRSSAADRLETELDAQVFPDGGHVSRCPMRLVEILSDLLPLRIALVDAHLEVPAGLNAVIERMLPMVRFFMHGDDGLCLFNGVSNTMPGRLRDVLAKDSSCGKPLMYAPHSGYARIEQRQLRVIMDCGTPPIPGANAEAHISPLAFEFSDGANRIVVSCGSSPSDDEVWRQAGRMTAAHSTVCLGDQDAAAMLDNRLVRFLFDAPVIFGPGTIKADAYGTDKGAIVEASHDGYFKDFGIVHERRLFMGRSGDDLRGEERFRIDLSRLDKIDIPTFAIRFHLHPSVKATLSQDGGSIVLMQQDRHGWRFSARGGILSLEDSVYLPNAAKARKSKQIVVAGVVGRPDQINWAFKRIEKRAIAASEPPKELELPL